MICLIKVDPKLSKVIQDKVSAPVVNIGEAVGKLDDKWHRN